MDPKMRGSYVEGQQELDARHLGMFIERHQHSGEITTPAREMSEKELIARATQFANRVTTHISDDGAGPSTNGEGA